MSCIAYPEIIDPRRSFQEYSVASVTSADSPQSLCCERLLRSLNLVKPAAWRLELRVAKFLCCFHCKLLDNRTIDWSALFGFLLEPFPYSIIHVRVLWSTVTLLRTGKSSFVLLSYKSLLFENVTLILVFFHNWISQQVCVLLSILCYFRILLRFENVFLKVIRSLLSALFYLLAWFNGVSNRTQPGQHTLAAKDHV